MLNSFAGQSGTRTEPSEYQPAPESNRATFSVRQTLREAVDEVHLRLHGMAAFAAIADGSVSWPDYTDLLRRLHHFHRTNAPTLERAHARLGAVAFQNRADLLQADLAALGEEPVAGAGGRSPDLSDDEAIGLLYTMEGSLLGGTVINRQLDSLFGQAVAGRRFFAEAPQPRDRWARVCAALEQHGSDAARLPAMCRGALASFTFMEECLGN